VVVGTPTGETVLDRIMSDESVPVGERVLTSGGDGIYAKGLPVGVVDKVIKKPGEVFWTIRVRPAASLSRLEEVLVITQRQEREPAPPNTAKNTRAVDVLSARLPGLPAKTQDSAGGTPAAAPDKKGAVAAAQPKKPKAPPADGRNPQGSNVAAAPNPGKSDQPVAKPAPAEGDRPQ
jgi:rod shape-determining protein MreC